MKKTLALILAVVFVLALFAGCSGSGTTQTPSNTTSGSSSTGTSTSTSTGTNTAGSDNGTTAPVEDEGPYHFAYGKFQYNESGYVDESYEYELPLSTTDEIFTYWTTCWTPQYLPEGGMKDLETLKYMEEVTGVHIEYEAISSDSRSQNFSVLLASDDLRDISDQALYFYTGDSYSALEDGWFINFYDYRDYMPNYLHELWARNDIDVLKYGRLDDTTWPAMYGMVVEPAAAQGYMLRQDWMDKYGLGDAIDVTTLDKWHDVLTAFKSNGVEWPLAVYSKIDLCGAWGMWDTSVLLSSSALPAAKVIDGTIWYSQTTAADLEAVTLLNQWYKEGLIDPNYASYSDNNAFSTAITSGTVGCVTFTPSEVGAWESSCVDPDAKFLPTPYVKLTEDQVFNYGHKGSNFHLGSASVSAKCSNIELVCTWLDWKWSPSGSEIDNWGPEGFLWNYDENGNKKLTEIVTNNPDGLGAAWVMVMYTNDGLRQPCLNEHKKMYAYDGGEIFLQMFNAWKLDKYTGAYDVPTGIKYTPDQTEELNKYSNDIATYISENWYAFFDGSKSLTEWDSYVADIYSLGLQNCIDVVQEAYDAYVA